MSIAGPLAWCKLAFVSIASLAIVLVSAALHPAWNLLLKGAVNQEVFTWWMRVAASVVVLPAAVYFLWNGESLASVAWLLAIRTAVDGAYFLFLGRCYAKADLSLAYPIIRGVSPALGPIVGVVLYGEVVTSQAAVGIGIIVVGIYVAYWWGRFRGILSDPLQFLRHPGTRYALLTGLAVTVALSIDKEVVGQVSPFLYLYIFTLGGGAAYAPYLTRTFGRSAIAEEWRTNGLRAAVAGLLYFGTYGAMLTALQFTRISYLVPAREAGIVVGVLLGVVVLKEPVGRGRVAGSLLIVAGLALIATAR